MVTAVEALTSGGNLGVFELHKVPLSNLPQIVSLSFQELARRIDPEGCSKAEAAKDSFTPQVTVSRDDPCFGDIFDRIPLRVRGMLNRQVWDEIAFINLSVILAPGVVGSEARVTFHDGNRQRRFCWRLADLQRVVALSDVREVEETLGDVRRVTPSRDSIQAFFGFASRLVNQNSTNEAGVVKAG